jgi:hypothetical protein
MSSIPGITGACRRASAILESVALVMARPRRAPEMVAGLQPEACARSVAFQPRRASSRSSLVRFKRTVIGFFTSTSVGYTRRNRPDPAGVFLPGSDEWHPSG